MVGKDLSADDISFDLVSKEKEVPGWLAKHFQCAINAFQRQGFINLKLLADSGHCPLTALKGEPNIFVKGYSSRFLYQNSAVWLPLWLRDDYLRKEHDLSLVQTSAITAATEAVIGSPLELRSVKETLKKSGMEIKSPQHFVGTSRLLFLPLLARNFCSWLVVNGDDMNIAQRGIFGGIAGLCSAPFDSLANQVMRIDPLATNMANSYKQAWKNINLSTTIKASPYRGAGGAFAAMILSKEFGKEVAEVLNPLYQAMTNSKESEPIATTSYSKLEGDEKAHQK